MTSARGVTLRADVLCVLWQPNEQTQREQINGIPVSPMATAYGEANAIASQITRVFMPN